MTDQLYEERDDERESGEGRGPTEEHEEGKPYTPDDLEPEQTEDESAPDF